MKEKNSNNKKKANTQKQTKTTKKVTPPKKEKNTKQNVILAGLILVILICVFFSIKTIVNSSKTEETTDKTVNEEILKDAKVGNLTITHVRLTADDDITNFMANVNNETDEDYYVNVLYVTFSSTNITRKIPVLTNITIKAHDHKPISLTLDSDITDTTNIDYELK